MAGGTQGNTKPFGEGDSVGTETQDNSNAAESVNVRHKKYISRFPAMEGAKKRKTCSILQLRVRSKKMMFSETRVRKTGKKGRS